MTEPTIGAERPVDMSVVRSGKNYPSDWPWVLVPIEEPRRSDDIPNPFCYAGSEEAQARNVAEFEDATHPERFVKATPHDGGKRLFIPRTLSPFFDPDDSVLPPSLGKPFFRRTGIPSGRKLKPYLCKRLSFKNVQPLQGSPMSLLDTYLAYPPTRNAHVYMSYETDVCIVEFNRYIQSRIRLTIRKAMKEAMSQMGTLWVR